jgi:CDP-glucose 4,6-dehydratase
MADVRSAFRGRRVFVTGHTGFKGSWLTTWLNTLGAYVMGYSLSPDDDKDRQAFGLAATESVYGDIRDGERLGDAVRQFAPDFVFHLAAQPLVRTSYERPVETFDVNVMGAARLLEALTGLDRECTVVVITSDKVYQNPRKGVACREEDPLGGFDPYSASKAAVELLVRTFRNSYFNPSRWADHRKTIATTRAGNVIGGGDWSRDRILPDIVRAFRAGCPLELRNPDAVRPWQHVLEPVYGYLLLATALERDRDEIPSEFNFGPRIEDQVTVREIVEHAMANWPGGSWSDGSQAVHPHEDTLLRLDTARAAEHLGWRPRLNVAEAVAWAVEWYRAPFERHADVMRDQIERYCAKG